MLNKISGLFVSKGETMKLSVNRLSVLAIQAQRYVPVLMTCLFVLATIITRNPLDTEGGTGR